MFTPFFCHWYVSGAVPAAVTVNVAVCPAVTVWFAGWVVIVGATGAALTVSVADALVTVPAVFVTTTLNFEPLAEIGVASVAEVQAFALPIFTPFFCHWYVSGAVP